ncbi:hypothetical protein ACEN4K_05605 [Marinilactibacillus psychrotolerans]|uniref:hypothetical protein n=1 Tax=Marinilactibacillus psychrotolerans TaxID=191770 RepID=UPI00388631D8
MDWNTLLIATIPALITGIISYISASKKSEAELDKAKVDQETAFKTIEANQKLAIESIEKTAQNEIEKMRAATLEEIKFYEAKSKTDMEVAEKQMTMEHVMPFAAGMFSNLFSGDMSTEEAAKKMEDLQKLSDSLNKLK